MLCFHFSGGVGDTGAGAGAGAATASDTDSEGMYEFSASIFQHMMCFEVMATIRPTVPPSIWMCPYFTQVC